MENWIYFFFLHGSKIPFFPLSPLFRCFFSCLWAICFSRPMLKTIFPLTCILITVWPSFFSLSFIFSFHEISFITWSISFSHFTLACEVVVIEISFIKGLSLSKEILSFSMKLAINKITFIYIASKFKLSFACLLSINEISFILYRIIIPRLNSFTVIQIIHPISFVHAAICSNKYSKAVCFSVFPVSLINISIWMS